MGAGDVDVQIAESITLATVSAAVGAAIAATSTSANIAIAPINDGAIVIVAVEQ